MQWRWCALPRILNTKQTLSILLYIMIFYKQVATYTKFDLSFKNINYA